MSSGEGPPSGVGGALQGLDRAAGKVIEARALVMTLPADEREELRALTDVLLAALGRRIAAELPASSPGREAPEPGRAT